MFLNPFKKLGKSVAIKKIIPIDEPQFNITKEEIINDSEIINSKVIQDDIKVKFDTVLENFNLLPSHESKVKDLKSKLDKFRKDNEKIYKKSKILSTLGFINTPTTTTVKKSLLEKGSKIKDKILKIKEEIKSQEELKLFISNYNLKYPGFKFIDDETMLIIMKKYDLFIGDTWLYNKEIPDNSLDLISKFSKHIESTKFNIVERWISSMYYTNSYHYDIRNSNGSIYRGEKILLKYNISNLLMIAPISHFNFPRINIKSGDAYGLEKNKSVGFVNINRETRSLEYSINRANELAYKKEREILDPIAVLKVQRGYIIIDAWDEEADIPEIQNEMLN